MISIMDVLESTLCQHPLLLPLVLQKERRNAIKDGTQKYQGVMS